MSRTRNSLRNIAFAVIFQVIILLVNFLSRTVFLKMLGKEYLGLNGLFSNILSILSIAELGIGTSIVFSLYKPLAENDHPKVTALMSLYKKAYIVIGGIILVLGLSITPFLRFFIKEVPDIPGIEIIYIMFVLNSSLSYLFIYKQSLIIADQKQYIVTKYRNVFTLLINVFQIIVLCFTGNYFMFLSLSLLGTLTSNLVISMKVDKMYPYMKNSGKASLDRGTMGEIIKNIKGNFFHRIGEVVVLGTDNLLMSRFVGIVSVGMYSNYLLISASLNTFVGLVYASVTASVGNLNALAENEHKMRVFNNIYFFTTWVYGFMSICLFILFNPFITLWLGEDFIFSNSVVFLIVVNFYITGTRRAVLTYTDAMGLYWHGRYKALCEAVINLIASIILVNSFGIMGILLGTFISTITTCFWAEPLILYKYGFKTKTTGYFIKYVMYTAVIVAGGFAAYLLCIFSGENTVPVFVLKMLICAAVPNIIFMAVFHKTREFRYFGDLGKNIIKR